MDDFTRKRLHKREDYKFQEQHNTLIRFEFKSVQFNNQKRTIPATEPGGKQFPPQVRGPTIHYATPLRQGTHY